MFTINDKTNWYTLTGEEISQAKKRGDEFEHNVNTHLKTLRNADKMTLRHMFANSSTKELSYKYACALEAHSRDIIVLNSEGIWAVNPEIHND